MISCNVITSDRNAVAKQTGKDVNKRDGLMNKI